MNRFKRVFRMVGLAMVGSLAGCLGPQQKQPEAATYVLQSRFEAKSAAKKTPLVLLVQPMRAHAGFDQTRMAYQREAHRIEYYAYNRWVDAPTRMLTPLLTHALEVSGAFAAVVRAPASARSDLRLETELVSLVQDFTRQPSQVRLVIRAQLIDTATHQVRGTRQVEARVHAATDDARGGAAAASQAASEALGKIADWSADTAHRREQP